MNRGTWTWSQMIKMAINCLSRASGRPHASNSRSHSDGLIVKANQRLSQIPATLQISEDDDDDDDQKVNKHTESHDAQKKLASQASATKQMIEKTNKNFNPHQMKQALPRTFCTHKATVAQKNGTSNLSRADVDQTLASDVLLLFPLDVTVIK